MERSTIFNGKIHYKWQFSIAMLVYQRVAIENGPFRGDLPTIDGDFFHSYVKLPEGIWLVTLW